MTSQQVVMSYINANKYPGSNRDTRITNKEVIKD